MLKNDLCDHETYISFLMNVSCINLILFLYPYYTYGILFLCELNY